MGYIFEASGGFHYRAYSTVDIVTGKPLSAGGQSRRVQQSVLLARRDSTHTSKSCLPVQELAVVKAREIEAWETSEAASPDAGTTVATFYESVFLPWLESLVVTGKKSHATLVTYKRYWKTYLAEHFRTKTLMGYRPSIGEQFLRSLRREDGKSLGESTVKHIHSTASGIFTRAAELGYIGHNPWREVKVANVPSVDVEQGEAFTEQDVETMIARLDSSRTPENDMTVRTAQTVLAVGIWAGLRPSECVALRWDAVDFEHETVTVHEAYVYGQHKSSTKTGRDRVVPFRDRLTPVLKSWWEATGRPQSGLVFSNRDGRPVNLNSLADRVIRPICEATGISWDGFGFYALRRGYGSLLVKAGWSCEEVAQAMGNTRDVVWKYYFVDRQCELAANARERERRKVVENVYSVYSQTGPQTQGRRLNG
jgi:integrase